MKQIIRLFYGFLVMGVVIFNTGIVVKATQKEETTEQVQGSKAKLIYELAESFEGDGTSKYVDTKIKLYDGSINDWIVMACISNDLGEGDNVFLSCFSEKEPYRGLLLRNPTGNAYEFICGMNGKQWTYMDDSTYFTIAVQKKGNQYSVFYNGEVIFQLESEQVENYDGSLLLGCELDGEGKPYRYGKIKVDTLRIYSGTQSPSITASQMEELLSERQQKEEGTGTKILKDRQSQEEIGIWGSVKRLLQKEGPILLLLAVGLIIVCVITITLDKHKKNEEE